MSNTDPGAGWQDPTARADATGSAKEMAQNVTQTVKQEAQSFAADAKDKAVEQIEQHKETATRTLGDFADAIRKAGDELSQHDQSMAGRLVSQAADGLETLSRSVSDKRPEELLEAVRDFGRRNPTALIAGSVLAGLALGRFLRSSGLETQGQGFSSSLTAPGGAPQARPLPGDDFHSDEGAASAGGAVDAEISDIISVAGDDRAAMDGDDRDAARFREPGI